MWPVGWPKSRTSEKREIYSQVSCCMREISYYYKVVHVAMPIKFTNTHSHRRTLTGGSCSDIIDITATNVASNLVTTFSFTKQAAVSFSCLTLNCKIVNVVQDSMMKADVNGFKFQIKLEIRRILLDLLTFSL